MMLEIRTRPGVTWVGVMTVLLSLSGLIALRVAVGAPGGGTAPESRTAMDRTVALSYHVGFPDLAERPHKVSIWIPQPRETLEQAVELVSIRSALPHQIVQDTIYGNRFLRFAVVETAPGILDVDLEYIVRRSGKEVRGPVAGASAIEHEGRLGRFLEPDRLVPTGGVVAARASETLTRTGAGSPETARLLYDEVISSMRYDKSGAGWGRGDAVYACTVGSGNCTDFHSLFTGMARAANIPSRFVMGLPLPTDRSEGPIDGYHCWAEFHDRCRGWVPVDASEAWKHPEQQDFYFGRLDPNRVEFTIGRDIPLPGTDTAEGASLNYAIYPHVEIDGAVYHEAVVSINFRNLPDEIKLADLARSRAPVTVEE